MFGRLPGAAYCGWPRTIRPGAAILSLPDGKMLNAHFTTPDTKTFAAELAAATS
jgi:hypothetical protein